MGLFEALFTKGIRISGVLILLLSQVSVYATFLGTQSVNAANQASAPTLAVAPNNWDVNTVANVQADDFDYATENDGQEQGYAGFDFSTVPAGSTIDGVTVNTLAGRDGNLTNACQLRIAISNDGGATYSSYKTRGLTPDFSYLPLGGQSDTWGLPLTDTTLTQNLFVVKVDDHDPGTNCDQDTQIFLDQLIATVHYTAPAPEPTYTICHATSSATNPYSSLSVNESAIDGGNDNGDHYTNHTGPLAATQEEAQQLKDNQQDWGDIIPPVPGSHSGLNWTAEGQAILQNGCAVPENDDPMNNPFVRITFICKAESDGVALAFNGESEEEVTVTAGDYIFRIRYEANNSDVNAPANVPYTTNMFGFSGDIDKNEVVFETTATSGGGVTVLTTPENLYVGTASTNENQICDMVEPEPVVLMVTKFVDNDDGGTVKADEFGLSVNGELLVPTGEEPGNSFDSIASFEPVEVEADVEFTISEDEVQGYAEASIGCFINGDAVGYPVTPTAGDTVTCNVFNYDQPPTVSVTKFLRNLDVGTALATDFVLSVNDTVLENGSLTETSNGNSFASYESVDVQIDNEFTITETEVEGYELLFIQCFVDGISVGYPHSPALGEEVSCNVINQYAQGSVSVIKDVSNQWGGTLGADNFTLLIEALGGDVVASGNGAINIMLAAGDYQISENSEMGYMLAGFVGDCSESGILSVVAGESASCTVFNEDQPAKVIVSKSVMNDDGGTLGPESFSFDLMSDSDGLVGEYFFDENGQVELTIPAGSYAVVENEVAGYENTENTCVSFEVSLGEHKACNVVNDDIAPIVTVSKYANPCSEQPFDFVLTHQGDDIDFTLTDDCNNGVYSITDTYISDELIDAGPTNNMTFTVQPGEVTVMEEPVDGWYQTYANCYNEQVYNDFYYFEQSTTFTAELGQEYYCEFENAEYSTVEVTKFNDYNQDGEWGENEPTLPAWDMVLTDECDRRMMLKIDSIEEECEPAGTTQTTEEDGMTTFVELEAGLYSLDEVLQDGWTQSALSCDIEDDFYNYDEAMIRSEEFAYMDEEEEDEEYSFRVRPGQNVECVVGNFQDPKVDIVKTNNTKGPVQRGTEVTFTLTVTVPSEDESGILQGAMDDGDYLPVTVEDNLTDEFEYVDGSFTANSNVRGNLKAAGITTDPSYASPGTWTLTTVASNQVVQNEIITLTYRAIVGSTTPAGAYPTTAQVTGYGDDVSVVVSAADDDEVVVQVPGVLGASTATAQLATTGDDSRIGIVVGLLLVGAVAFTRRRNTLLAKQSKTKPV